MNRQILAPVLAACIAVGTGCCREAEPDSVTCVKRLADGGYQLNPDGSIHELGLLIQRKADRDVIQVLVSAQEHRVIDEVVDYLKSPGYGDDAALKSAEEAMAKANRTITYADILVCRGDTRGLVVMGNLLREFEARKASAKSMEERVAFEMRRSAVHIYLVGVLGRRIESGEAFLDWLATDLPKYEFDMTEAGAVRRPPRLVRTNAPQQ